MTNKTNNKELISDVVLRRAVCFFLFPSVLLPCGVIFLFCFLCFFRAGNDFFSASVLCWTIFVFCFFWFISLIGLLFCLAIAFLQSGEIDDKKLP
ncbi:MAG: hypothetical protein LBT09_10720 [Planctomycetaceae bacterium]|jgi:heme/copper-type cytochrome/quinol oxidase subunit 1|nr:hypothetical protein [Planctomycetaceae bacterium]